AAPRARPPFPTRRSSDLASTGEDVVFSASGRTITFHGFLKAYVEGSDDPEKESDDSQTRLPNVAEGDAVSAASLNAAGHETKPPDRKSTRLNSSHVKISY